MSVREQERFRRDHRWARGRMSEYLDGELAGDGRRRMEHHLVECPACRGLLHGLRRTVDALGRLAVPAGEVDVPGLAASVRARLGEPA